MVCCVRYPCSLLQPPTASYSFLQPLETRTNTSFLLPSSFFLKLDASKSEHNVFRAFVLAFLLARPCFLTFLLKNDITTAAPWTTDTVSVRVCGPCPCRGCSEESI